MTVALRVLPIFRLSKKSIWLAGLLPLLFVSDILYGAMDILGVETAITPGVVLRGMVVLMAIYMVIIRRRLAGNQLLIWLVVMAVSVLPSLTIGIFYGDGFFFDLTAMSKTLYLPLVSVLFVVLIRRYRIGEDEILRYIEYAAYMLGLSLLLSQVAGFEKKTYGDYAFGSTGVFYAQNDMTLAFGLALLAGGYRLVMQQFSWVRGTLMGLSAFACVQIGTRASLGVLIGVALMAISCVIWSKEDAGSHRVFVKLRRWISGVFVLVAMLATLAFGWSMQQEFDYQQEKIEELQEGNFPRLLLVIAGVRHIEERNDWFNVFGEGADAFQRGVAEHFPTEQERRAVEVDWLDLFGNYGIAFTLLIHAFLLSALLANSYRFVIRHEPLAGLIAAAMFLYMGHAAFAGHALTSPIPSTLAAAYLALHYVSKSRRTKA